MEYITHILILICIYIILSVSLNLVVGYGGLLSIAHAAFYGIGAYTAALLSVNQQSPFLIIVLASVALSGIIGFIIGISCLRIHNDYFTIASFSFQIIAFSILNNWVSFTGGPMGVAGIPYLTLWGWAIDSHTEFLFFSAIACILCLIISFRLVKSPFGNTLKAIREDEVLCQSIGKNVAYFKLAIFVISACIASFAGILYAYYIRFVDPTSFTIMESIFIISIVIIGGAGNIWGSILATIILVILPEVLRFIGMPNAIAANMRQIFYGILIVLFMYFRPQGFLGKYSFRMKQ